MLKRREFLAAASMLPTVYGLQSVGALSASEPGILRHTQEPEGPNNSEPTLDELVRDWINPTSKFYVRSHAPAPKIDIRSFRISIDGLVDKAATFSVGELISKFKSETVTATMTCAGNRRSEYMPAVDGVPWEAGAIGNAFWGGIRLSHVLKSLGVKAGAKHVHFVGVDEIPKKGKVIGFGGSIPLAKAFADTPAMPGAMLCHEMNGQPLTPNHGYPMRTVVPGFIGARSVKWLQKITVSDKPSPNHYLASAYKLVTEGTASELAGAAPIKNYLTNSVICLPAANASVKTGSLTVRGYSLAEGAGTAR